MKQTVAHKKLGNLQGLLLILGLLLVLVFFNYIFSVYVAKLVGYNFANVLFWVLGGVIAWQLLRTYIAFFIYEMDDDVLRITRKYGRKERLVEDIYLSRLLYVGSAEEAKKRYPQAKRISAAQPGVKAAVTAVAYQSSAGARIALLQANDEIRETLVARMKAK